MLVYFVALHIEGIGYELVFVHSSSGATFYCLGVHPCTDEIAQFFSKCLYQLLDIVIWLLLMNDE